MAGKRNPVPLIAAAVVGVLLIIVIRVVTSKSDSNTASTPAPGAPTSSAAQGVPTPTARPGCVPVSIAASSEKAALMGKIAQSYSTSGRTTPDGACYDVTVRSVASGTAETALANDWDPDVYGPQPDVWTPAASTWIGLLRNDLTKKDKPIDLVPDTSESVTSTPLVLAMPKPMAEAMGWPKTPLGWADVLNMVNAKDGWASKGHKEWGKFTLGKTNPNSSTSGLAATIGTLVAATGKSSDLTEADLEDPDVRKYAEAVEHSVIHYGDTTLTYLSNLQRADDAGAAMNYVSAVAVEEKSVLDYNAGNPSGDPATLGQHKPPRVPLVAIYPKEGTLYSDSPYVVLNATWSTPAKQAGAKDFLAYLTAPEQQKIFTDANFRTFDHQAGDPIKNSDAVDADGVKVTLTAPGTKVLAGVRDLWSELRKRARVLLVLDESGSMGNDAGTSGQTRLDLAKTAAVSGLSQLSETDQLGVWAFTSDLETPQGFYEELEPISKLTKPFQATVKSSIELLTPKNATPLYAVTRAAVEYMNSTADPNVINAVVVMTDGKNEYPADSDLNSLLDQLKNSGVENGVRVFTIAYGEDADLGTLKQISEATRAAAYDARKPESILKVFSDVLSNF